MPTLRPWMFVRELDSLETEGMSAILDRLEAGGIDTVVLGDLWFKDGTPGFAPNPAHYVGLAHQPAALPAGAEARAAVVAEAVGLAHRRGFRVYLHDWAHGGGGQCVNDPQSPAYAAARTLDTLEHLPEISGFITDGPEWGYEAEPGNRQDLFRPLNEFDRRRGAEWGFDWEAMETGIARFGAELRSVSPETAALTAAGEYGFFDASDAFMANPGLLEWLRFRERSIREWVSALHRAVKGADPAVEVACGPRTAAFGPLAGYSLRLLREVTDFQCPKLYFWMHGIDGMKGSIYRWAHTLRAWNPGLSEAHALAYTYRLFGFTLPGVASFADLDAPLDREFFRTVVPGEIAKAVLRAGDASVLHPWMGLHHGGVRISTSELEWLLEAIDASPLTSLIYWHYEDMQPDEWALLQRYIAR